MNQILSWTADAALILLLGGTLVMAVRLDRALRIVGGDRAAFEALISSLSAATNAVKLGIQALRTEAERAADQIERRSEDADKMATDLSFLIEAADRAGVRLEQRLTTASKEGLEKSRTVAAADRLKRGCRYSRLRREEAAVSDPLPLAASVPPSGPLSTIHPEPLTQTAAVCFANDTPAALRQMAGITTRRHAVEQVEVIPLEQTERDNSERGRPHDYSRPETTQMKRVG